MNDLDTDILLLGIQVRRIFSEGLILPSGLKGITVWFSSVRKSIYLDMVYLTVRVSIDLRRICSIVVIH